MRIRMKFIYILACYLLVVSCSNNDNADQSTATDLPILSTEELDALFNAGNYNRLIAVVKHKESKDLAESPDFILAARAHLSGLDGIRASVFLDKIPKDEQNNDEYVLLRARTYMLDGQLRRAAKFLETHSFSDAGFYDAQLILGDLDHLSDEYKTAIVHYSAAIESNPNLYPAYIARAQTFLKLSNPRLAEADAIRAIGLAAENTLAYYTLGTVYNQWGRQDQAKQQFIKALEYSDANVPAMLELSGINILEGKLDAAEEYLDSVYELSPDNETAKFFSAMLLAIRGDDASASEQLTLISFSGSTNPQVARLLGHVAYRLQEYDIALDKLEFALESAPFDRVTRLVLGEIYILQGMPEEALIVLAPQVQPESTDLAAFSMAGLAAAQTQDISQAAQYTARSLELAENPDTILDNDTIARSIDGSSIKILNRRLATYHFQSNKPAQAIEILEKLTQEDKEDITSFLLLSNMQMQSSDFDAALKTADQIIELAPESAVGYNARGATLHRQGNYDEALIAYDKAVSINSDYISALKNRGALHLVLENFSAAAEDMDAVLAATPNDVRAQLMYARSLIETGEATEALTYFPGIERVFPQSATVHAQHSRALAGAGRHIEAIEKIEFAMELSAQNEGDTAEYLGTLLAEYQETVQKENIANQEASERIAQENALKREQEAVQNKERERLLQEGRERELQNKEELLRQQAEAEKFRLLREKVAEEEKERARKQEEERLRQKAEVEALLEAREKARKKEQEEAKQKEGKPEEGETEEEKPQDDKPEDDKPEGDEPALAVKS